MNDAVKQTKAEKKIERFSERVYWPRTKAECSFMTKQRKRQKKITKNNPAENWMEVLMETYLSKMLRRRTRVGTTKWIRYRRQKQKGFRIYDFWSSKLKYGIEVDGMTHDKVWDQWRDELYLQKYGYRVFRVKAFDEAGAMGAFKAIVEAAKKDGHDIVSET